MKKDVRQLIESYKKGENIIKILKERNNRHENHRDYIQISYDFQAGSYIKYAVDNAAFIRKYTKALASIIDDLGCKGSVMEAGVGEATTLGNVIEHLKSKPKKIYGFDISWSRIKYAIQYLKHEKQMPEGMAFLALGDLFYAPFQTDSIDVVYTNHSIEPNTGREKEALEELYRITKNYLVLLEPCYELANEQARKRMREQGYITNLKSSAEELGYKIIEYRLFDHYANELNPTGLIIIEKSNKNESYSKAPLACPVTQEGLKFENEHYFCEKSLLAYPILNEVPCLMPDYAVIATHYRDFTVKGLK